MAMNWHILGLAAGLAGLAAGLTIVLAFARNCWLGSRKLRAAIWKLLKRPFTKKTPSHVHV